VFVGLSKRECCNTGYGARHGTKRDMFALANRIPKSLMILQKLHGMIIIIATGRSDHPNQANNVIGFPFIFRGRWMCVLPK